MNQMRKVAQRKTVDYASSVVRYIQVRTWMWDSLGKIALQPTPATTIDVLPAVAYSSNPCVSFAAKFVHTSLNKNRSSINCVLWTPNGRRLITGSQSGEFTLWNGQSFNFEMIVQAHEQAIRSMVWSHNGNWMVSGDDAGSLKYWQCNMNNVKANKGAHRESIRDLSFCRTDLKFCSCSDDTSVKVWDFARCHEERSLTGHGWDVKSIDWHPTKSLLVSGGKDNLVKLWDAKTGRELKSFHGHKNTVLSVRWNQNGNWLLTSSKDQVIKLYDIRAMKEIDSYRGHQKDVTVLNWHPFHEEYFVSGSLDGSIFHWLVGCENPQIEVNGAHDNSVWDLSWHPIGYLLCSAGNDHTTKFWCRNRPGDAALDKFNAAYIQGHPRGNFPAAESSMPLSVGHPQNDGAIPGVGVPMPLITPSGAASNATDVMQHLSNPPTAPPLPPGPHPSLLAAMQHQVFLQAPQRISPQQQAPPFPLPPSPMPSANILAQQSSPHMPLLSHHSISGPHIAPFVPPPIPTTTQGTLPLPSSLPPSVLLQGIRGPANQMVHPSVQASFMGVSPLHSTSMQQNILPSDGGTPSGPRSTIATQVPPLGIFSQPFPGFNHFQAGGQPSLPPLPPGPPPRTRSLQ